MLKQTLRLLAFAGLCAYPFFVLYFHGRFGPMGIAFPLLMISVVRAWLSGKRSAWLITIGLGVLVGAAIISDSLLPIKFYPVLMNLAFLAVFAQSLLTPPSVVEQIAGWRGHPLTPRSRAYMRNVTLAWCLFFVGNGGVAAWSATEGSMAFWTVYNGFIAYILMGIMFVVERLVRPWFQRRDAA